MPDPKPHLLILGGTGEAVALAQAVLREGRVRVTSSLAGRTRSPARVPGAVRIGGFGGAAGLRAWIEAQKVDAVIDATHPFAARISAHGVQASAAAGTPYLRLARPPWVLQPGDDWRRVRDVAAAVALLPQVGRRAFLTVGASDLGAFAPLDDIYFLMRVIDARDAPPNLLSYDVIEARGPFTQADEARLMETCRIDVLVSKNSGGQATVAKIDAARDAGLPVIMIDRPDPNPVDAALSVDTVEQATAWLKTGIKGA